MTLGTCKPRKSVVFLVLYVGLLVFFPRSQSMTPLCSPWRSVCIANENNICFWNKISGILGIHSNTYGLGTWRNGNVLCLRQDFFRQKRDIIEKKKEFKGRCTFKWMGIDRAGFRDVACFIRKKLASGAGWCVHRSQLQQEGKSDLDGKAVEKSKKGTLLLNSC